MIKLIFFLLVSSNGFSSEGPRFVYSDGLILEFQDNEMFDKLSKQFGGQLSHVIARRFDERLGAAGCFRKYPNKVMASGSGNSSTAGAGIWFASENCHKTKNDGGCDANFEKIEIATEGMANHPICRDNGHRAHLECPSTSLRECLDTYTKIGCMQVSRVIGRYYQSKDCLRPLETGECPANSIFVDLGSYKVCRQQEGQLLSCPNCKENDEACTKCNSFEEAGCSLMPKFSKQSYLTVSPNCTEPSSAGSCPPKFYLVRLKDNLKICKENKGSVIDGMHIMMQGGPKQ